MKGIKPSQRYVQGRLYRCAVAGAPLYATPSDCKPMISQLLFGEGFRVLARKNAWMWGQMETDHYVGYVPALALRPHVKPTHRIAQRSSLVFARPDIKSTIRHCLSMGAQLCVTRIRGAFTALATGGFVWRADMVSLRRRVPKGQARRQLVIANARKFLTMPYLWGGRGVMGIDCSALIQLAFQNAGLACLRDCDLQEADLTPVKGAPCVGDLAYWPGHVGLLATAQSLLHASGGAMQVVEEPLQAACAHLSKVTAAPVRFMRPTY